jgi:hypothetical protein
VLISAGRGDNREGPDYPEKGVTGLFFCAFQIVFMHKKRAEYSAESTCPTREYRKETCSPGLGKMAGDLDFLRYLRNDEVLGSRQPGARAMQAGLVVDSGVSTRFSLPEVFCGRRHDEA